MLPLLVLRAARSTHPRRTSRFRVLFLAATLVLSSCGSGDLSPEGGGPPETYSGLATASIVPGADAVDFVPPETPAGTPFEVYGAVESEVLRDLLDQLGAAELFTPGVLAFVGEHRRDAIVLAFPQLATDPSAFALPAAHPVPGSAGLLAASMTLTQVDPVSPAGTDWHAGNVIAGALAEMLSHMKNSESLPESKSGEAELSEGEYKEDGATVTTRVTANGTYGVGPGGRLTGRLTVTAVVTVAQPGQPPREFTETTAATIEGDACPDGNGSLGITFKMDHLVGSGAAGAAWGLSGDIAAHVGDDAWLQSADFNLEASRGDPGSPTSRLRLGFTAQGRSAETRSDSIYEDALGEKSHMTGGLVDGDPDTYTETQIATDALRAYMSSTQIGEIVLKFAQNNWRNGGCVVIDVPEGTSADVAPREARSFSVNVHHKWEGTALEVPVTAEFSGKEKVDPTKIDKAPGTFTMTTGDDEFARSDLETVSRRGRDTETVVYSVAGAYRVVGGADELQVDTVVCDVTGPFTLVGSGITQEFVPTSPTGGTYSYTGSIEGATLEGEGTYTITVDENGGTIDAEGTGRVRSPVGTFSAYGKERYTLTPATCES